MAPGLHFIDTDWVVSLSKIARVDIAADQNIESCGQIARTPTSMEPGLKIRLSTLSSLLLQSDGTIHVTGSGPIVGASVGAAVGAAVGGGVGMA